LRRRASFRPTSLVELERQVDQAHQQALAKRQWGRWHLDDDTLELVLRDRSDRVRYTIDLERVGSSTALCDWVFQVSKKNWATVIDLGNLVRALNDIFDPQARLCSFGATGAHDRKIDATAYLRARYGTPVWHRPMDAAP
jgi:hypothetical protein